MPDLLPRSTVGATKKAPPRSATSDRRLEANPTHTFRLLLNFFPEFFSLLEQNFVFPGVFQRMQLENRVVAAMERNYKAYQRGGTLAPVEMGLVDANAIIVLIDNPSLYRIDKEEEGINSIEEFREAVADANSGQAGPGTSQGPTG
mgnify:FL=1